MLSTRFMLSAAGAAGAEDFVVRIYSATADVRNQASANSGSPLAIDSTGQMYLALNNVTSRVVVFDSDFNQTRYLSTNRSTIGVWCDSSDNLYLLYGDAAGANQGNGRTAGYSSTGTVLFQHNFTPPTGDTSSEQNGAFDSTRNQILFGSGYEDNSDAGCVCRVSLTVDTASNFFSSYDDMGSAAFVEVDNRAYFRSDGARAADTMYLHCFSGSSYQTGRGSMTLNPVIYETSTKIRGNKAGGCYVVGDTANTGGTNAFMSVYKVTTNLTAMTWAYDYTNTAYDTHYGYNSGAVTDDDGNLYVSNRAKLKSSGKYYALLHKIDSSGNLVASKRYLQDTGSIPNIYWEDGLLYWVTVKDALRGNSSYDEVLLWVLDDKLQATHSVTIDGFLQEVEDVTGWVRTTPSVTAVAGVQGSLSGSNGHGFISAPTQTTATIVNTDVEEL